MSTPPPPPLATVLILEWLTVRLRASALLAPLAIETAKPYEGISFPYILISIPDPGRPFYTLGMRASTRNGVYLVRGVHKGRGITPELQLIAAHIVAQLHGQRDDDAGIVSCALRDEYMRIYPPDAQTFTDLGATFAISATG